MSWDPDDFMPDPPRIRENKGVFHKTDTERKLESMEYRRSITTKSCANCVNMTSSSTTDVNGVTRNYKRCALMDLQVVHGMICSYYTKMERG